MTVSSISRIASILLASTIGAAESQGIRGGGIEFTKIQPTTYVVQDFECTLYLLEGDAVKKVTDTANLFHDDGDQQTESGRSGSDATHESEIDVLFDNHIDEESWICGDIVSDSVPSGSETEHQLHSVVFAELRSTDLDMQSFLNAQNVVSGGSKLLVSSIVLTPQTAEVFVPEYASIRVETDPAHQPAIKQKHNRKLAPSSGKLSALMVRVLASDGSAPQATEEQLFEETFDSPNGHSLAQQHHACSYGKLNVVPYADSKVGVYNGMMDIQIDIGITTGVTARNLVTNRATAGLKEKLGDKWDDVDIVMFCLPGGTVRSDGVQEWLAYALTNNKITYYNDENNWCRSISLKMHEIGHNMNLAHSGESKFVDDTTGVMGLSYAEVNAEGFARMCFNVAKNYQLGWYDNQKLDANPLTDPEHSREYKLINLNRYSVDADTSQLVILRLVCSDLPTDGPSDYFIGFNEKKGINDGTKEDFDKVVIYQKSYGNPFEYGPSIKRASLSFGQSYEIKNYNNQNIDVVIKFESLVSGVATIKVKDASRAPIEEVEDPNSCKDGDYPLTLEILGDMYPDDISWTITKVSDSSTVAFGSGYTTSWKLGEEIPPDSRLVCIPNNDKYKFVISDLYADGICCAKGIGYYRGLSPDGQVLFAGGKLAEEPYPKNYGKTDAREFIASSKDLPKPPQAPPSDPPTNAPQAAPTNAPQAAPTNAPQAAPTNAPQAAPTEFPTKAPIPATPSPTRSPSPPPTTNSPTASPSVYLQLPDPTDTPTASPIPPPTNAPVDATPLPTVSTNAPTKSPVDSSPPPPTPTNQPQPAPTSKPPTQFQEESCDDDIMFAYQGDKKQNCKWVGQKKSKRCKLTTDDGKKVADSCPGKCLKRCKPCKDKKKRFKIDGTKYTCKNFAKKDISCSTQVDHKMGRGKKIQQICNKSCGVCQ